MSEIDKLADFIMKEIDCEPSRSEGAGECAIRIIKKLQARIAGLEKKNAGLISRSMVVNNENIALKNDYAEVKDRIAELEKKEKRWHKVLKEISKNKFCCCGGISSDIIAKRALESEVK